MDVRIVVEATVENGTTKIWRLHCLSGPFRGIQPEGSGHILWLDSRQDATHSPLRLQRHV